MDSKRFNKFKRIEGEFKDSNRETNASVDSVTNRLSQVRRASIYNDFNQRLMNNDKQMRITSFSSI